MAKNWTHSAGLIWPMLVNAGTHRATLTYEQVASVIHTNPLSVRHPLELIQAYCLENRLAPLTVVVVGKNSGRPGDGFVAWDVDDLDSAKEAVAIQNWSLVENPFGGFGPLDDEDTFAAELLAHPDQSGDVYHKVRDRGVAQQVFRRALLTAYNSRCAICGLSFVSALEAAHILPWGDCAPRDRLDVRNGLLLCASHHRLFDAHQFTITDKLTIHYYDHKAVDGEYTEMDRSFALAFHGKKLKLPKEDRLRPGSDYLLRRLRLADEC